MSNLKYKQTWELRREILEAVGVDSHARFDDGSSKGIRKNNLVVIASKLQPEDEMVDYSNARLKDVYSLIGEWVDVEHSGNAGRDWTMNRDILKAIHEAVHNE